MTPNQCKMARAGTGLGIRDLAAAAQVSTNTVTRFESGKESVHPRTVAALRAALEAAGASFPNDKCVCLDRRTGEPS